MAAPTLVAGVGNIFLGDDGFGSAVVQELRTRDIPPGVDVVDYGIRGVHLAFDLSGDVTRLILIDAMPQGEEPGTLSLVEVSADGLPGGTFDAHSMDPNAAFQTLATLGGSLPPTLLVGCEPGCVDEGIGLTDPVAAAVGPAAEAVLEILSRDPQMRRM